MVFLKNSNNPEVYNGKRTAPFLTLVPPPGSNYVTSFMCNLESLFLGTYDVIVYYIEDSQPHAHRSNSLILTAAKYSITWMHHFKLILLRRNGFFWFSTFCYYKYRCNEHLWTCHYTYMWFLRIYFSEQDCWLRLHPFITLIAIANCPTQR